MKLLRTFFLIFFCFSAYGKSILYGSSSAVLNKEIQELLYRGFLLAIKNKLGEERINSYIKIRHGSGESLQEPLYLINEELTVDTPLMVVGFPSTHESQLIAPILQSKKILTIFASSTNSNIKNFGKYIYSTSEDTSDVIQQFISLIKEKFPKKKGTVLYNPEDFFSFDQKKIWEGLASKDKSITIEFTQLDAKNNISKKEALVAHDIRSPLAALDMIISDTTAFPEEQRAIVRQATRRIHDIADSILSKKSVFQDSSGHLESQIISSLLIPLLAEKRVQFYNFHELEVEAKFNSSNYGACVRVDPTEFQRVISNLINNSVEAMNGDGKVEIYLSVKDGLVEIIVSDNGPGVPSHILPKLMQKGATFGKDIGSGFGLFHAKTSIEKWGGSIAITSTEQVGTNVILSLPVSIAPSWFLPKLILGSGTEIIVLDDDPSIHQVWDSKFKNLALTENSISVKHFSNPQEIRDWLERREGARHFLFLFDHELIGSESTGLDIIEEFNFSKNAILVTSHYEDPSVRERCSKLSIPLVPKNISLYLPISINAEKSIEAILIDDDEIVRLTWKMEASRRGMKLQTYSSPKEFCAEMDSAWVNVPKYIDSNLGSDLKGEDFAYELSRKGHTNLYLCTGHPPEKFSGLAYLTGVIGKSPPWSRKINTYCHQEIRSLV